MPQEDGADAAGGPAPPGQRSAPDGSAEEPAGESEAGAEARQAEATSDGGEAGRDGLSAGECAVLLAIWLACVLILVWFVCRAYAVTGFSFHLCFSLAYLTTFYLGFPLSAVLVLRFQVPIVAPAHLGGALGLALVFHLLYQAGYAAGGPAAASWSVPELSLDHHEAAATAAALMLLAAGSLAAFIARNGLLLFKLRTYSQTFTRRASAFALRRLFPFFLPGMLIVYFLHPGVPGWLAFLAAATAFGALVYVAVGGTRATLAMALALFVAVGVADGHLKPAHLPPLAVLGVAGMALLALARYRLPGPAAQQVRHAVMFTRDTLSPWENLALILRNLPEIDRQGLAPVGRDFFVYVPRRVWPARPDVVMNTPNYFTRNVLGRGPGVTISPTLIGSCLIMGGLAAVPAGALACGRLVRWYDQVHEAGRRSDPATGAVIKAFCFGSLFNLAVLAREGPDSFVSRFAFYGAGIGASVLAGKTASRLLGKVRAFRRRTASP